jgi:hypothetical protein
VLRFQLMTLTSLACAPSMPATLRRPFARTSHTCTLRSAEHEPNTVGSPGDHCRSSTEAVCAVNGCACGVKPAGPAVVRKICAATSPESRRSEPGPLAAQSSAKPSARPCAATVCAGVCARALSSA